MKTERKGKAPAAAPRFASVEAYLASLDGARAETMRATIEWILQRFPDLEVKLAWNVPQIHRGGKYVFGFSAATKYLLYASWSPRMMEDFGARIQAAGLEVNAKTFRVPVGWKQDKALICDLVAARLGEL